MTERQNDHLVPLRAAQTGHLVFSCRVALGCGAACAALRARLVVHVGRRRGAKGAMTDALDRIAAYQAKWRAEHPDYHREYRAANRVRYRELQREHMRRARQDTAYLEREYLLRARREYARGE